MSNQLKVRKVAHTIRRGQLRFGLHAYNNETDIGRAVEAIREGLAARVSDNDKGRLGGVRSIAEM